MLFWGSRISLIFCMWSWFLTSTRWGHPTAFLPEIVKIRFLTAATEERVLETHHEHQSTNSVKPGMMAKTRKSSGWMGATMATNAAAFFLIASMLFVGISAGMAERDPEAVSEAQDPASTRATTTTEATGDVFVQSCGGCDFFVSPNGTLWRGGVECKPETCNTELRFDGSRSIFKSLSPDVFKGMTRLYGLLIVRREIYTVPEGVFQDLSSLTQLCLNENQMVDLPSNAFRGLTSLQYLGLARNKFTTLPYRIFDNLVSLDYLELDNNQITMLPNNIFTGLPLLQHLSLGQNYLQCLPTSSPHVVYQDFAYESIVYDDGQYHLPILSIPKCPWDNMTTFTDLSLFTTPIPPSNFDFIYDECVENRSWEILAEIYKNNQEMMSSGYLGSLATEDFDVWACFKNHPCIRKVNPSSFTEDSMCYKYNEKKKKWHPWDLQSLIKFCD